MLSLKSFGIYKATRIQSLLYRYQDPFYLRRVRLPRKHGNFLTYYVQDCGYIGTRSTLLFGLSNKMTSSPKISHRGKMFYCTDLILPTQNDPHPPHIQRSIDQHTYINIYFRHVRTVL